MRKVILSLFFYLLLTSPPSIFAAQPWATPFAENTSELTAAAKKITRTDSQEVIILLSDHNYQLHKDGRIDATIRLVYRIDQSDALEDWSSMEQQYQPWYQDKPQLRARVITADGNVHWLDPKTIADAPARVFEANIFSDARVLRAPFPSVVAGAIVEYEVKIHDRLPLWNAGVAHRVSFDRVVPMEQVHLRIQGEPGVSLNTSARQIPDSAIKRTNSASGALVEVVLGPTDPPKDIEANLPFEESYFPYVTFSTAASWQSVAAAYADMVDARIASTTAAIPLDPEDKQGSPLNIARRLAAKLHKRIRYTGVEFGEAAIVPVTPAEAVSRGYGDCKDKATVLVAMLRAAGLKADVALLLSGFGPDVDASTPGMGQFDHAIVYVESNPPLWIDATAADVRVGMLPPADQGRFALIANPRTTSLAKISESSLEDNWQRNRVEIRMSELGTGEARATVQGSGGWFESSARSSYGGDGKRAKQSLEWMAKNDFRAKSLGSYKVMLADDLSGPYQLEFVANQSSISITGAEDAVVILSPLVVFQSLPFGLFASSLEKEEAAKTRRKSGFVFPFPFQSESRFLIVPPAGFKLSTKPESVETKLGPAAYTRKYLANPDGTVEVLYRLDVASRRWTAEDVEAFRAAVKKYRELQFEMFTFLPQTSDFVAAGQFGKAIAQLKEHLNKESGNAMAHARFARLLVTAGMGVAALAEAKEAVRLDPKAAAAWSTLGWIYQHDALGRQMTGDWNYAESEKAFRKSLELDPEDYIAQMTLAILLEHNARGWRYAKDSKVDQAIAIYRKLAESGTVPQANINLAVALTYTGQLDLAKEALAKCAQQTQSALLPLIQAMQEGPARGIASATAGVSEPRQRAIALAGISISLSQIRNYPLAQAFMSAAARAGNMPELNTRAELLGKVKRWEETLLPESDPAWPLQHILSGVMRGVPPDEALQPVLSTGYQSRSWESALPAISDAIFSVQKDFSVDALGGESLLDYIASLTSFEKTGDEKYGFRLKSTMPGWAQLPSLYVANQGGKFKFIGVLPDALDAVGDHVLELLNQKDVAAAQWWLDRVVADVEPRPDGTGLPPVRSLWAGTTPALRGPAAIRLAAASLIGSARADDASIQLLRTTRTKATTAIERDQLDKALSAALVPSKKWDEVTIVAKRLLLSKTFSEEGFRYLIKAAAGSNNWKDLEFEARKRATANPTNTFAVAVSAIASSHVGNSAGVAEGIKKLLAPNVGSNEQAVAAWMSVESGNPNRDLLDKLKSVGRKDGPIGAAIAMLQASLHQPDEAMQSLLQSLSRKGSVHLGRHAWLAYAKICEEYGLPQAAEAAQARSKDIAFAEDDLFDLAAAPGSIIRVIPRQAQ